MRPSSQINVSFGELIALSGDDIFRNRHAIEKIIAALYRSENRSEVESTLSELVLKLADIKTAGAFSKKDRRKLDAEFPSMDLRNDGISQPNAIILLGSLNGDNAESMPLLSNNSHFESIIRKASSLQHFRSLTTRLFHAITDFILAFPRENFSIIGDINLALLLLACVLPGIRLTFTLVMIFRYTLNYNTEMSETEKLLPACLKLKDQLVRHAPVLLQDFVWCLLRGAACDRQDEAPLFTTGLFLFLVVRNVIIDRLHHYFYQDMINKMVLPKDQAIRSALHRAQREAGTQNNIAIGIAACYALGAALAMITYFEEKKAYADLLPIGGAIIGLTASVNFVYEFFLKKSVTALTPSVSANQRTPIETNDTLSAGDSTLEKTPRTRPTSSSPAPSPHFLNSLALEEDQAQQKIETSEFTERYRLFKKFVNVIAPPPEGAAVVVILP